MKKKAISLLLAFVTMFSLASTAFATSDEATSAANALYELGLFQGTGTDANGSPIFDLDRAPTRHEAVTMLVKLLGKGEEALAGTWDMPFTDVAEWAKPYVGYAYANDLTSGTSATTYSGNDKITASQYLTFVLRALGYDSNTDFKWDKAWELSDQIGLTDGRYNAESTDFLRGDVAIISNNALDTKMNGTDTILRNSISLNVKPLKPVDLGTLRSGLVNLVKYDGKQYSFYREYIDYAWNTPGIDVKYSTKENEIYGTNRSLLDLVFGEYYTDLPNRNQYTDGAFTPYMNYFDNQWLNLRRYEISSTVEYTSATTTLEIETITYFDQVFEGITAEEFIASGLKDGSTGTWNGVRFFVCGGGPKSSVYYNLNDIAAFFGIQRRFSVEEAEPGGNVYLIIKE